MERPGAFGCNIKCYGASQANGFVQRVLNNRRRSCRQAADKGSVRKADGAVEVTELRTVLMMKIPTVITKRDGDRGHIRKRAEARDRFGLTIGYASAHDRLRIPNVRQPDGAIEKLGHAPIGVRFSYGVRRHFHRAKP